MKVIANLFSYLFHPLLSLTYMLLLMMVVDPYIFGSYSVGGSTGLLAMVIFSTFLMPAFVVFLMYQLDFLKNLKMPNRQDRIIPLLAAMVCYFSVLGFLYKQVESPEIFQIAVFGTCIGMSVAFVVNVFYKISLHAIGMGAIFITTIYLCIQYSNINLILNLGPLGHYTVDILVLLFLVIIVCGIVLSSRLYLKAHTPRQVYTGFGLGMFSIFLGYYVYNLFG